MWRIGEVRPYSSDMTTLNAFLDEKEQRRVSELWRHWARMPSYTRDEAAALLSGLIPTEHVTYDDICRNRIVLLEGKKEIFLGTWDLLLREEINGRFDYQIPAKDLLDWATEKGLPVSSSFLDAHGQVGVLKKVSVIGAESVGDSEPPNSAVLTRERETFLYLIAAMSVTKYGFNPNRRNSAASEIRADLEKLGVPPLCNDTIRAKLQEASELIPQSFFKSEESSR